MTTYHVGIYQSLYWTEDEAESRELVNQQSRRPEWTWTRYIVKKTAHHLVVTLRGSR